MQVITERNGVWTIFFEDGSFRCTNPTEDRLSIEPLNDNDASKEQVEVIKMIVKSKPKPVKPILGDRIEERFISIAKHGIWFGLAFPILVYCWIWISIAIEKIAVVAF